MQVSRNIKFYILLAGQDASKISESFQTRRHNRGNIRFETRGPELPLNSSMTSTEFVRQSLRVSIFLNKHISGNNSHLTGLRVVQRGRNTHCAISHYERLIIIYYELKVLCATCISYYHNYFLLGEKAEGRKRSV